MLAVEGIYQNEHLFLSEKVEFTQPVKVIVTFLEEKMTPNESQLEKLVAELYASDKITFKQAQSLLNHQNWQDTVTVLELEGCQLSYDFDDWEEDLARVGCISEASYTKIKNKNQWNWMILKVH
jgi:predicted HTH domain antitoxin